MAHRHGGDIVCAVAANCSPCSSEPVPLLHFSPPPRLFILCPYYFISQPCLSPLSSLFPRRPRRLTQLFHLFLWSLQWSQILIQDIIKQLQIIDKKTLKGNNKEERGNINPKRSYAKLSGRMLTAPAASSHEKLSITSSKR